MIITSDIIREDLSDYASPANKLSRLVKDGEYIQIIRGLYVRDRSIPPYLLAGAIYGPSYLSFEYALSYHGLIPEAVYNYTSVTFAKKKKRLHKTELGTFIYRDIPESAYPHGLLWKREGDYAYLIASPEKALCDQLYKMRPVANYRELEELLFADLRIDEDVFWTLDREFINFMADKYSSRNVQRLAKYMDRQV